MTEKKKISLPILVEGKYDKNTLSQIFDANIITLGGFGVFNSKEKQQLIRFLSEKSIATSNLFLSEILYHNSPTM